MTRSIDFDTTVRHGTRVVQPDLVIYARQASDNAARPPKIGLIVARSVGTAVQRHQLARRLRHIARELVRWLEHDELVVIRALPSSRGAASVRLAEQLRAGFRRIQTTGSHR
jgi:ribonuclease P protein component